MKPLILIIFTATLFLTSIAQGQSQKTDQSNSDLKRKVIIVPFSNETDFTKEKSYDLDSDPVPKQGFENMVSILNTTGKFIIVKRYNGERISDEIKEARDMAFQQIGADYLIFGSINKLGIKSDENSSDPKKSKTRILEVKVKIKVIDILSGQTICSGEATGEAETLSKGSKKSRKKNNYDPADTDKAIAEAVSKLSDNIINKCLKKPWKTFFLTHDTNGITISGGKSQGFKIGDTFDVIERGKILENKQTSKRDELPGKIIGEVRIELMSGEMPSNEYSVVSYKGDKIDEENLFRYYIMESEN
jgi:curli biogenesis system outer membrane secretion channel CsgG